MNTVDKNKVVHYIDLLVKMSGEKETITTLEIERKGIEEELKQAHDSYDALRSIMSPERYYNANEDIVNNAIESSLIRRNNALELEIKSKKELLESKTKELDSLSKELLQNADNITRSNKCISTLSNRLSGNIKLDEKTVEHYNGLIEKSENNLATLTDKENSLNVNIDQLNNEIDRINREIENYEINISKNNEFLKINNSKSNNNSNEVLKTRDEKEAKVLEERINDLEIKKLNILNNPVLIAERAKKALLEDDDVTLTMTYIRKLAEVVSKNDFMDINYDESFEDRIKDILEKAETERNNFAKELDGKNYDSEAIDFDVQRKEYLEKRMNFYNDAISTIRTLVGKIDSRNGKENTKCSSIIEKEIKKLNDDIVNYEKMDELPNLRESEIQAAINKKKDQINVAKKNLSYYQLDVISDVDLATTFENSIVSSLELANVNLLAEIQGLESKISLKRKSEENYVEKALDGAKLKELAGKVVSIKNRKKFKESPMQIVDLVENIMGMNLEPTVNEEPVNEEVVAENIFNPVSNITEPEVEEIDFGALATPVDNKVETSENKEFNPITFEDNALDFAAPIDLSATDSYNFQIPNFDLENDNNKEVEDKRGSKVVGVEPVVEETILADKAINPFNNDTEGHIFDFNGNLLNNDDELEGLVDFNSIELDEPISSFNKAA